MKIKTKISLRKLLLVVFCLSALVIIIPKNKRYINGIGFVSEHEYYHLLRKMTATPTPRPVHKVSKSLEPPGIPSEYGWQLVSDNNKKINEIWWKNKSMTEFGVIELPGNEWVYVEEIESEEEWRMHSGMYKILQGLESDGWKESGIGFNKLAQFPILTIGDYMFFSTPTRLTSDVSFIKRVDNDIRVLSHRLASDRNALIPSRSSEDYIYPHMQERRIFVSDLVTEEQVLSKMEVVNEDGWLIKNQSSLFYY